MIKGQPNYSISIINPLEDELQTFVNIWSKIFHPKSNLQNMFLAQSKLDLYPKCGHCATIWIHALFAYQDSLRPKITKNAKKMKMFDPSCSWDIA